MFLKRETLYRANHQSWSQCRLNNKIKLLFVNCNCHQSKNTFELRKKNSKLSELV